MNYADAKAKLDAIGQSHLLQWYDTLSADEQSALLAQIDDLDLKLLDAFHRYDAGTEAPRGKLAPLGALTLDEIRRDHDRYTEAGLEALRARKVGAVLLAGGMGTRLGFDKPKGMFNIGVTRTLYIFECLIRNLQEVTAQAGVSVPLFITSAMTSRMCISLFRIWHPPSARTDTSFWKKKDASPPLPTATAAGSHPWQMPDCSMFWNVRGSSG